MSRNIANSSESLIRYLDNSGDDLLFMGKVSPILGIIRARENNGIEPKQNSTYDLWRERLSTIFTELMQTKLGYMQLRYLDENGNEMVRVDRDEFIIKTIPKEQLQNKANRKYFIVSLKLDFGNIHVLPINLNREQGKIEIPYKPTMRYATPIFSANGERRGIVISNLLVAHIFQRLKQDNQNNAGRVLIINQDGYYLFHPDEKKEWGFELNTDEKLPKDHSEQLSNQI